MLFVCSTSSSGFPSCSRQNLSPHHNLQSPAWSSPPLTLRSHAAPVRSLSVPCSSHTNLLAVNMTSNIQLSVLAMALPSAWSPSQIPTGHSYSLPPGFDSKVTYQRRIPRHLHPHRRQHPSPNPISSLCIILLHGNHIICHFFLMCMCVGIPHPYLSYKISFSRERTLSFVFVIHAVSLVSKRVPGI